MTKRLITLRQIQAEKLPRSRSWIFAELKAGRFVEPLDTGGKGSNLWEEEAVDSWLASFIASAKNRAKDRAAPTARSMHAKNLAETRRSRGSTSANAATMPGAPA